MKLRTTSDFKSIVLNETPLIDVRAPIEFEKGAFLNTVNIPIMDDVQRHVIGIKYKEEGNENAVALGHQLVSGKDKADKIDKWTSYINEHPDAMVYCFRGGQRSRIAQEWIIESLDREVLRLEGGFKRFRNYLLDAFAPENQNFTPIRLGGQTGSGKTLMVYRLEHSIDLEGIANHRGSAFGGYITPQPNPINFENHLAYRLIQQQAKGYSHLVFEDEGRHIGRCFIPKMFSDHMRESPLVVVNVPLEERASNILKEYVVDSQQRYLNAFGEEAGMANWLNYILDSVNKAKKRLGGTRHKNMVESIRNAYDLQKKTGSTDGHFDWIEEFLREYYDPMYEYQLANNSKYVEYSGTTEEVIGYLNHLIGK